MPRSTPTRLLSLLAVLATAIGVVAPAADAGGRGRHQRAPRVAGMVIVESERPLEETWDTLVGALEANPAIRVVATIDHAAAAAGAGLELPPNRVVVFGNPNLGTPLMQANQVTGMDLPQKIHVFEDRGRVWVGFNDATWLEARHGLDGQPTLDTIAGALRNLAGVATGTEVDARAAGVARFRHRPGLVTVASDADIDTTWDRLLAAIDASPAAVAFTVDHQAGAASVGLDLRPTRLVVFGNPNLGTPLMQERPTSGIDLPVKILVWTGPDGVTRVTTNDVTLARRHRLSRRDVAPLADAVTNFVAVAAGHRSPALR